MDEWQEVCDDQGFSIPPRDLKVTRDRTGPQAFREIVYWVREQGVAIGEDLVYEVSFRLLEFWQRIPIGNTCIVFRPNGWMKWPLFQYQ